MRIELYQTERAESFDVPANEGLDEALGLISTLQSEDVSVEIVDASKLSREELQEIYLSKACIPAVRNHVRIRRVFGSKRRGGGPFFGREVPALLVYEDGEHPSGVYPHEKPGGVAVVTIRDFLMDLVTDSRG